MLHLSVHMARGFDQLQHFSLAYNQERESYTYSTYTKEVQGKEYGCVDGTKRALDPFYKK